jgi:autotransporter passenger strand-loop-strand repeat protein
VLISSGGVASSTTLLDGGQEVIKSSGTASATTISNGGSQIVSSGGITSGTLILLGGQQLIYSSAIISSSTVSSGGSQLIYSGGSVSGSIISNGGSQLISSGGIASATIVNSGGVINVSSGGSSYYTQIKSGGNEYILSGGYGPSATISSGGTQTISFGGLDIGTTILSGGSQIVGGIASSTIISGIQTISSGGSGIDAVIATRGAVNAISNSYIAGYTVSGSSASILASGTVTASSAGGAALVISGNANSIRLDNASLGADVQVTGTSNNLTLQNSVTVANGLSLVDNSNTNNLALKNQSLTVASTTTAGATTVSGWNQIDLSSSTSFSLAGNLTLSGVNSLLNIDSTSNISQNPNSTTITANTVKNYGTILINSSQTLNIVGNYQQNGGTLRIGVSGANYGKMVINGNVLLSNALFSIANNSTLTSATTYSKVLSATGTITGGFSAGVYQGINYSLVANGLDIDLVTGQQTSSTRSAPLLNGGQATTVLNQTQATIQVIRDRMEKIDGQTQKAADSKSSFWATPYAYQSKQSANGFQSTAYSQNTGGLALGSDSRINNALYVGGALAIQNSYLNGKDSQTLNTLNITSYQLTGYAKQKFSDTTELNLIANAALDQNNSNRLDGDTSSTQTASASYKGWHGLFSAELNNNYLVNNNTFSPMARIDYSYAHIGGYNESGAGTYNLGIANQNQSSLIGSIGGKYRYNISDIDRILLRASAGYDFMAKPSTLFVTDANGLTYMTTGNNPGLFVIQAGVGYEMQAKNNMKIRFSYDYLGRNGYSNNMINANMIWPF